MYIIIYNTIPVHQLTQHKGKTFLIKSQLVLLIRRIHHIYWLINFIMIQHILILCLMKKQLAHHQQNLQQVQHRHLLMPMIFLIPRSLFLRSFSIDEDSFLLKCIYTYYVSVFVCI